MTHPEMRGGNRLPTFRTSAETDLFERIDWLVDQIGSSKLAAETVGVSVDTVARWRKGPTMPPFDKLAALCRAAGFHVDWLATGEGPRDIEPKDALTVVRTEREHMGRKLTSGTIVDADDHDAISLPRLSVEGSAGYGLVPAHEEVEDYLSVSRRYLAEVGINPRKAHVLRLSGHSMAPTLLDRDLIIVDTAHNSLRDEEIYSVVFGDTILIKRLMPLWDGSVRVMSDNKNGNYPDAIVPAADRHQLRIIGRVGGYLRYF